MKKFKNSIIALFILAGFLTLNSCEKLGDFGDTNISPNSATVPLPSALLTDAIDGISQLSGRSFQTNATLYVQWLMQTQYPDEAQYASAQIDWATFYVNPLENLQKIIDLNTNEDTKEYARNSGSNANQLAVARIFKAYIFSLVTDMYGDVPYKEALTGMTSPVYDKQEDIYKDLLKELTEAIGQFDNGAAVKGDILFNGNAAQWKRFANSLRLRLSLRLSKVYPGPSDYAATQFKAALSDPAGYISTNGNNAFFTYLDDTRFRSPWEALFDGRADYAPSDVFVDTLEAYSDPRIPIYFTKDSHGGYTGVPYGLKRDDLLTWENANPGWSLMGDAVKKRTSPGYIVVAAEIAFDRAEAAQLQWTTEDAAALYNEGVRLSFEQWGVYDAASYAAYIANPATAFTPDPLRKIGTQKWIALYPTEYFEAWAEWRRTGYPRLTPARDAVNESKQIPRRYQYPANEPTLNGANYSAAVGALANGDKDHSRVWWDKQ